MPTGNHSALAAEDFSPVRRFFAFTMLLLGLAVFCWGLHDKLSLYAPPSAPPPVAKAKLLSPDKQITALSRIAVPDPQQPATPVVLLLVLAAMVQVPLVWTAHARPLQFAASHLLLGPALRRRPPPAFSVR